MADGDYPAVGRFVFAAFNELELAVTELGSDSPTSYLAFFGHAFRRAGRVLNAGDGMPKHELLVFAAVALVAGCTSDRSTPTGYEVRLPLYAKPAHAGQSDFNFNTHLTGDEETPPNASPAQGQAVLRVSDDGSSVDFQLIASNINNVVQAHIHCGPPNFAGPIRIWLFPQIGSSGTALTPPGVVDQNGVLASGTFHPAGVTCPQLTVPNVGIIPAMPVLDAIRAGLAYVNVHTNAGPGHPAGPGNLPAGEIRGQLDHRNNP